MLTCNTTVECVCQRLLACSYRLDRVKRTYLPRFKVPKNDTIFGIYFICHSVTLLSLNAQTWLIVHCLSLSEVHILTYFCLPTWIFFYIKLSLICNSSNINKPFLLPQSLLHPQDHQPQAPWHPPSCAADLPSRQCLRVRKNLIWNTQSDLTLLWKPIYPALFSMVPLSI